MDRRTFLTFVGSLTGSTCLGLLAGCRGHQYGHVLEGRRERPGGQPRGRCRSVQPADRRGGGQAASNAKHDDPGGDLPGCRGAAHPKSICFVGVENKSIEELGDFKDQIYQQIDTMLVQSQVFQPVSRRVMDAALRETRLRPDSLLIPENMRCSPAVLERQGQPLNYLLFATVTSGTTERNKSQQRDYLLTLEMVNVQTGATTSSRPRSARAITRRGPANSSTTIRSRAAANGRSRK